MNTDKNRQFFVGGVLLISARFFSFTLIPDRFYDYVELLLLCLVIFLALYKPGYRERKKMRTPWMFRTQVNLVVISTLCSALPAYYFHEQSFFISVLASRTIFFWLFYYVLHKMRMNGYLLEKLLLGIGITWALVMLLQQITYPNIFFNLMPGELNRFGEEQLIEQRGGIPRIYIAGTEYGYFLFFFAWRKLNKGFSMKYAAYILLALAGLLLTESRQVIFAVLGVMLFDFLQDFRLNDARYVRSALLLLGVGVLLFAVAGDFIFSLIELSKEQKVTAEDYIRTLEINFFLFKYWPHWTCYLLGNGWEHDYSAYGQEFKNYIEGRLRFFRSDIGIIGAFNKFGIFNICCILSVYYKVLFPGKENNTPRHIRLFFITCFLTAFSGGNYFEISSIFLPIICSFYLIEKSNENYLVTYTHPQPAGYNQEGLTIAL